MMQRDAVAQDLQRFSARCPQAIHYGEDGYDEYADRWEAMEKKKADILQLSQTLNQVLLHATKQGSEPHSIMSDETSEWFRILETVAFTFCRRPPCTTFSLFRTITQPTWDTSTKQFTK
eukprot:2542691-Amphidinium_carterae.1